MGLNLFGCLDTCWFRSKLFLGFFHWCWFFLSCCLGNRLIPFTFDFNLTERLTDFGQFSIGFIDCFQNASKGRCELGAGRQSQPAPRGDLHTLVTLNFTQALKLFDICSGLYMPLDNLHLGTEVSTTRVLTSNSHALSNIMKKKLFNPGARKRGGEQPRRWPRERSTQCQRCNTKHEDDSSG